MSLCCFSASSASRRKKRGSSVCLVSLCALPSILLLGEIRAFFLLTLFFVGIELSPPFNDSLYCFVRTSNECLKDGFCFTLFHFKDIILISSSRGKRGIAICTPPPPQILISSLVFTSAIPFSVFFSNSSSPLTLLLFIELFHFANTECTGRYPLNVTLSRLSLIFRYLCSCDPLFHVESKVSFDTTGKKSELFTCPCNTAIYRFFVVRSQNCLQAIAAASRLRATRRTPEVA
mmetsp:Transcript_32538/g.37692  ORF Transcript_32538/g.37692 Transcript_32538/m.37692 type:complete len:233 (-) Transcript_32538:328-1026(-)